MNGEDRAESVRVAAVQLVSVLGDVAGNTNRAEAAVREAAAEGAVFIVLPEAAVQGYLSQDLRHSWHALGRPLSRVVHGDGEKIAAFGDLESSAETVPGPATDRFAALARELEVYVVLPMIEKAERKAKPDADASFLAPTRPSLYYNASVLLTPAGEIGLHYRKNNLWGYIDYAWATAGDGCAVLDTPYGRVGLAICFDVHVMFDRYAPLGLWTLLYSIAWVDDQTEDWFDEGLPTRTAAAGFNVVGANWGVDEHQRWNGYGFSRIIDSSGVIISAVRDEPGQTIVYADLPRGKSGDSKQVKDSED